MVQPEHIISQLLLRHNCVIVPDFGGFVAKRTSAVIDHTKGIMLPPKKGLLFNRQLINNDGLLISELSAVKNISFDEATQAVKNMVQHWNLTLNRGARVSIDKVGHLFFDQEKNLCFEQDRFFNLLLESYGLGKVHFVPQKAKAPVIQINTGGKSRSSAWKYVAAACLLPIAFYSFWIPAKTNVLESGMFSWRDFNPFSETGPAKYSKENPVKIETDAKEEVSETGDTYEFLPGVRFPVKPETHSLNNSPKSEVMQSEFIVGCFASEENANAMIRRIKSYGLDAYIFDRSNGLARVSAGSGESDASFNELRSKLSSHGINGWIYRKN
jgi:hypothetical protein